MTSKCIVDIIYTSLNTSFKQIVTTFEPLIPSHDQKRLTKRHQKTTTQNEKTR